MKRIFAILLIAVLAMSTSTYAASQRGLSGDNEKALKEVKVYGIDVPNSGEYEPLEFFNNYSEDAAIKAVADCTSGTHQMWGHGWGDIYDVRVREVVPMFNQSTGSDSKIQGRYIGRVNHT